MISHSEPSAVMPFGERELRSATESLSYLATKFFGFGVICSDPRRTCNRIVDIIRFLERNFEREEWMMDVVGYPEAISHKKEHKTLLRELTKMKRTLVCSRYDNCMLFDLIADWQKSHIPRLDEPLGRYLHEYAAARRA